MDSEAGTRRGIARPTVRQAAAPLLRFAAALRVLRLGAAGLAALARGPWLAWLPVELLRRLPGELVRSLPVRNGRLRYRTGFVARRAAKDRPPSARCNRPCATPRSAWIPEHTPTEPNP